MSAFARLALVATAASALAACSFDAFTYTVDRYGTVQAHQLRLGCRDTYEVFDRPSARSLLVTTNGLNEALSATCGEGSEAQPKDVRMRRVAQIFLDESTDRRDCRLTRTNVLGELHVEYAYACGTYPPPEASRVDAPIAAPPKSTTSKRGG